MIIFRSYPPFFNTGKNKKKAHSNIYIEHIYYYDFSNTLITSLQLLDACVNVSVCVCVKYEIRKRSTILHIVVCTDKIYRLQLICMLEYFANELKPLQLCGWFSGNC